MAQNRTTPGDAPRTELSRDLGLWDITLVGVAGMIGAGIFVLTGIAAGQAGPALLLAFALNGVVTLLTGMVYAELGSAIPEAGDCVKNLLQNVESWYLLMRGPNTP